MRRLAHDRTVFIVAAEATPGARARLGSPRRAGGGGGCGGTAKCTPAVGRPSRTSLRARPSVRQSVRPCCSESATPIPSRRRGPSARGCCTPHRRVSSFPPRLPRQCDHGPRVDSVAARVPVDMSPPPSSSHVVTAAVVL